MKSMQQAQLPPDNGAHIFRYRGFHIWVSSFDASTELMRAIKQQVDLALSVNAKAEIKMFFQASRIELVPRLGFQFSRPAVYSHFSGGTIRVSPTIVRFVGRPVLLHELLHAIHHSYMPNGFLNAEIISFYRIAVSNNLFPLKSHMLQNEREFFSCSATTFLFGTTGQEPFCRDRLCERLPDFAAYLSSIFTEPLQVNV